MKVGYLYYNLWLYDLEGITSDKYTKCFDTPEFNNGKSIMATIKMLKKYKDRLKINQIQLKDNT